MLTKLLKSQQQQQQQYKTGSKQWASTDTDSDSTGQCCTADMLPQNYISSWTVNNAHEQNVQQHAAVLHKGTTTSNSPKQMAVVLLTFNFTNTHSLLWYCWLNDIKVVKTCSPKNPKTETIWRPEPKLES